MVNAPDALHQVQSVTVRITFPIERSLVIKTGRIGNQGVSFPPADGVSHPKRTSILVVRTPIRVDSAHKVIELEKHDHLARNLNDLHWKIEKIDTRHTWRKTTKNWIAQDRAWAGTSIYGIGRLEFGLSPWRHGRNHFAKIKINGRMRRVSQPRPKSG